MSVRHAQTAFGENGIRQGVRMVKEAAKIKKFRCDMVWFAKNVILLHLNINPKIF
ncbi:MAG: hypothetical protein LBL74_02425 [Bacteroidales bacterium]|jgi:hypothetical protein|nr:hypothetical protein [Bacteroidales bacterium]